MPKRQPVAFAGVDNDLGLIYSEVVTADKVHDLTSAAAFLNGDEEVAHGDSR